MSASDEKPYWVECRPMEDIPGPDYALFGPGSDSAIRWYFSEDSAAREAEERNAAHALAVKLERERVLKLLRDESKRYHPLSGETALLARIIEQVAK